VLRTIPANARFRLSAVDDFGHRATIVRSIRAPGTAGGLSWGTVLTASLVAPRPGLWGSLAARLAREGGDREPGLWERLRASLDPLESRPRLAKDIEVKTFHLRWGNDYAVIANPRRLLHYRLEPGELELVELMD